MERREFIAKSALSLVAASLGAGATGSLFAAPPAATLQYRHGPKQATGDKGKRISLAFVIYPGMTPLDIIGPATMLGGENFDIHFVWRDRNPVHGEMAHVQFLPSTTFRELKKVDVLCITGTGNPYALLKEHEMIDWLHEVGGKAEWITSVCTGSILLGAAGLLQGYQATTHWSMIDDLKPFGAIPVNDRVVIDRNRITGGGVTAGIDFGLTLQAELAGKQSAEYAQLITQYDPHPPFHSGTPQQAAPELVKSVKKMVFDMVEARTPDWQQQMKASVARMQRYNKA